MQEFHLAVPDPYLFFFISTGLWLFYDVYITNSKRSLVAMYVAFALGMLTKGPIALALPGLVVILFLLGTKDFKIKVILRFYPILGILLTTFIILPWYLLIHIKTNGAWTYGFFFDHNLNRFGGAKEGHGGSFVVMWLFILLGLLPFSFFIFSAFRNAYRNRKNDVTLYFSAIVSLTFIGFFSISGTKLPNYPMPCYPFIAFMIANLFYKIYKQKIQKYIPELYCNNYNFYCSFIAFCG